MKNKKSLETKDIVLLIKMKKMCNENCCADCIFDSGELGFGCLYSRIKDTIVEKTEMAIQTLDRLISTACEASEPEDD